MDGIFIPFRFKVTPYSADKADGATAADTPSAASAALHGLAASAPLLLMLPLLLAAWGSEADVLHAFRLQPQCREHACADHAGHHQQRGRA